MAEEYKIIFESAASTLKKEICFICGAPKSGTTWLQLLLDAHPEIQCRGEGHLANVLCEKLKALLEEYNKFILKKNTAIFKETEGFPTFTREDFHVLCQFAISLMFSKFEKSENVRILAEKTPDNVKYLDFLRILLPQAKFIHVVRDGRDVAVSAWYHNLRVAPAATREKFENIDIFAKAAAHLWNQQVSLAEKFIEKYPGEMIEVRYEDLLTEPKVQLNKVFEFLRVNAAEDIIEACRHKASFESLSGGRAAGEEDQNSHFRKGTSEQWRKELSRQTLGIYNSIAGDTLRRYKYELPRILVSD